MKSTAQRGASATSGLCIIATALLYGQAGKASAAVTDFISFDVPGAQWTRAWDANNNGIIVGIYKDSGGVKHGFMRSAAGAITTVDYPGASETALLGINDDGDLVGRFISGGIERGFELPHGSTTYLVIDPPGSLDTQCHGINASGQIVGRFWDYKNDGQGAGWGHQHEHGFLLDGGVYQTIDYPDSGTSDAWKITDGGTVIGDWSSSSAVKWGTVQNLRVHGYRLSGGSFTPEDVPGAQSTGSRDANSSGQEVGNYADQKAIEHAFLRDAGTYTLFDYPGAVWTNANGLNEGGTIVGSYQDAGGTEHAFIASIEGD